MKRQDLSGIRSHSQTPLVSPRLPTGQAPPELSPLDAFAAQSRFLAKQLEHGTSKGGRRISRLPPLTIESSFGHNRPGFFRSASADESSAIADHESSTPWPGAKTEIEQGGFRPVSVYPLVGNALPPATRSPPRFDLRDEEQSRGRQPPRQFQGLNARMEQSPSPIDQDTRGRRQGASPSYFSTRPSIEPMRQRDNSSRRTPDITGARGYDARGLAPPRSPFAQKPTSINSASVEDSDEDLPVPLGASSASESRKFSTSSGLSNSPISPPFMHTIPRSPSVSSEFSATGSRLSRPIFNFSRPLSRASGPPMDMPSRQASSDSQLFVLSDDTVHTPISMHNEEFQDNGQVPAPAPSFVYSRFTLPRGKFLQRSSGTFQDTSAGESRWEQLPAPYGNVQSYTMAAPPSPPSRLSTSSVGQKSSTSEPPDVFLDRPSIDQSHIGHGQRRDHTPDGVPSSLPVRNNTAPSIASGSTIKAAPPLAPSADLSAEEHVTKGIDCHERGSLNESTYHLRVAARQNHPTGMLLYALACRHGWGMRANQQEGVQWLRKAADFAISEVADDEDLAKGGKLIDVLEQRTRKAHFALSIYELGVSHMNGWGIEQDKVLALRCFEIAGAWGDGDALAEAGFCYAQGIGCKKDLKKSAGLYRLAESKGISMVGNSWIHKSKYQDSGDSKQSSELPEKKTRNKSRSRNMFGRKKSIT